MSREAETLKDAVGEPGLVGAVWHGYEIGGCDGSHYMAIALLPTQRLGLTALLAASAAASNSSCDGWFMELPWDEWLYEAESYASQLGNVAVLDKPGGDVVVWRPKYNWDAEPPESVWVSEKR